jgi:phage tail sheath protein FI
VAVFRIDPATEARGEVLATATAGEGGWVDLAEPLRVRAGDAFVAVADAVARLVRSVEEGVRAATAWAAFEPDTEPTWARVRQAVADYLAGRWREGALVGAKPQEAFFVRCDRTTMTQADVDAGRLVCLVGVAPVRPAEFVIFRIGQWTADARP